MVRNPQLRRRHQFSGVRGHIRPERVRRGPCLVSAGRRGMPTAADRRIGSGRGEAVAGGTVSPGTARRMGPILSGWGTILSATGAASDTDSR